MVKANHALSNSALIVNLGSKENKESTWKDCFGIILCNKNVERMGFCYYKWRENYLIW